MTMTSDDKMRPDGFSLRRWSQRKLEVSRELASRELPAAPQTPEPPAAASAPAAVVAPDAAPLELPPVESLTPESDFTAFMQPKVDDGLRRQALKKLFTDPHFNVMDGLDVYIDDYTKPDPIPASVLERLAQSGFVRGLGAPPPDEPAPPASPPAVVAIDTNAVAPAADVPAAAPVSKPGDERAGEPQP
jgi:uncharacterized protein DUF3306